MTPPTSPSLQGSLRDLGVADVLTLLSAGRRSGFLLVSAANQMWLLMAEGDVVAGGSSSSLSLARNLLASGDVTAAQLEGVLGLSHQRGSEPSDRQSDESAVLSALAEVVEPVALRRAIAAQEVAAVAEMLRLRDGELRFSEGPAHPLAATCRVPTEEVFAAAVEQTERWDEAAAAVGGDAAHLRRVRRITRAEAPVTLSALEWAALSEIDERATVGQVAHRLGLGRYDAYVLLGDLVARNLLELPH